jgi:hypothetical protein
MRYAGGHERTPTRLRTGQTNPSVHATATPPRRLTATAWLTDHILAG